MFIGLIICSQGELKNNKKYVMPVILWINLGLFVRIMNYYIKYDGLLLYYKEDIQDKIYFNLIYVKHCSSLYYFPQTKHIVHMASMKHTLAARLCKKNTVWKISKRVSHCQCLILVENLIHLNSLIFVRKLFCYLCLI